MTEAIKAIKGIKFIKTSRNEDGNCRYLFNPADFIGNPNCQGVELDHVIKTMLKLGAKPCRIKDYSDHLIVSPISVQFFAETALKALKTYYLTLHTPEHGVETVDHFSSHKEATEMLKEYRLSDPRARYYISSFCNNYWRE